MLVLSRKVGERINIGNDVVLTVVEIGRGKVRVGIQAPREVPIYRTELLEQPADPVDQEHYMDGAGDA